MSDKFKGKENCEYCGEKIVNGNRNKRFCSDRCRVYFNREKKNLEKLQLGFTSGELSVTSAEINKSDTGKVDATFIIGSEKKKGLEQLISNVKPIGLGQKKQPQPPAGLTGIDLTIWKKENLNK